MTLKLSGVSELGQFGGHPTRFGCTSRANLVVMVYFIESKLRPATSGL